MDIKYIKDRLRLMKEYLENPDYEMVGLDSVDMYGIDINNENGGNVLKSSIDSTYIRIMMFEPFASVLKNKKTNILKIGYKFDEITVDLNTKIINDEKLTIEDIIFIENILDFFEMKKAEFYAEK